MPHDKMLIATLIASLFIHVALIATLPSFSRNTGKNAFKKIEVTYQKIVTKPKTKTDTEKMRKAELSKRNTGYSGKRPPQFNDFFAKPAWRPEPIQKLAINDAKPVITGIKKVSMPELKPEFLSANADLPKNPVYLKYYQIIRDKIRRYAYYNYNRQQEGEAYLSFVIASDGTLKALKVIDNKSTPDDYLKAIAAKSIKDASPYPGIPKELDYPELSFNVIIAFEVD